MQILVYGLNVPPQSMHIGKAARETERKIKWVHALE